MGRYADFERPPIVEAVLGIQFESIPLTIAHYGWFWKQYLGQPWNDAITASRLEDVFERFGPDRTWSRPRLRFEPGIDSRRFRQQFMNADGEHMLQLQDTRFVYNWKKSKGEGGYPSFDRLRPEFFEHLSSYQKFLTEADLPQVQPNQWEVVYVNYIPRGDLWDTAEDWLDIFPGFYVPADVRIDGFVGAWSTILGQQEGRLHIELKHSQIAENKDEIIRLQLTARGPTVDHSDLSERFEAGHAAIVNTFTKMTSEAAQKYWGRKS